MNSYNEEYEDYLKENYAEFFINDDEIVQLEKECISNGLIQENDDMPF